MGKGEEGDQVVGIRRPEAESRMVIVESRIGGGDVSGLK